MTQPRHEDEPGILDGLIENRITLPQAARLLGVCPASVTRWVAKGARGIRLETFILGSRRFTNRRLLERFIAATNAEGSPGMYAEPSTVTPGPLRAMPDQPASACI